MKTFNDLVERYLPLNEGLEVSYDIERLKSKLYRTYPNEIEFLDFDFSKKKYEKKPSKFGTALTIDVGFKKPILGDELKHLQAILDFFGYYIAKVKDNSTYFQIEPKYSIEFDPKEWGIEKLYHTTLKKNVPKIMRLGLIAKKTQTTFDHPPDRIYLFHSKYPDVVKGWMSALARNKNVKLEDMVLLSVKVKPYTKYYLDDTATIDNQIISVYTMSAIPSTEIEILIP